MKGFWLVLLLGGLLLAGGLVLSDLQAKRSGERGPGRIGAVERAERARGTMEAAGKAQERLLEGASRE